MSKILLYRGGIYRKAFASRAALDLLLRSDIEFAITGGLAVEAYVPSRVGVDVDVLFGTEDDILAAVQLLKDAGHDVREIEPGWQYETGDVDLLRALGHERAAVTRATELLIRGMRLPVVTLPDLINIKSDSERARDKEDLVLLRRVYRAQMVV